MPPPPPKAPKPGLAKQAPSSEDALAKSRREKDELETAVQGAEEELEALKARYDQYLLGLERREPSRWRDEVKKKVARLKTAFTRNTGLKFRIESLNARYLSYERLWLRSVREKEEGTYRRDLFKARLRHQPEGAASEAGEAETPPAPSPIAQPQAAAQKPPPLPASKPAPPAARAPAQPPPGDGAMTDTQLRALYNAYLAAKMTCQEDVSKLTYDAVARTVTKQIPELMSRYKAKTVEFKVEVKDGKAILKAIPKV